MIAPLCQTRFGSPEPPPPGRAPPCGWTMPRASAVTGCVSGALADAPAAPSVNRIRAAAASGPPTRSRACRADRAFDIGVLRALVALRGDRAAPNDLGAPLDRPGPGDQIDAAVGGGRQGRPETLPQGGLCRRIK